jgi:serine phosphatase RsbU (regulator of sigma subunit)
VEDLPDDRFVTLAAARLSSDGTLEVFSAAHGPLALRRVDGVVELLHPHTIPLGISPDLLGDEVTVGQLAPGDTLLMCSDGVTDTRSPDVRLWNADGLLQGLACHPDLGRGDLLRAIDHDNLAFAAGEPSGDDRTVVVATLRGT